MADRPELLHPLITPGNRILALTTDKTTAPHVAKLLDERGYGRSVLSVLENLGGAGEKMPQAEAKGFALEIGDFYVLAIDCRRCRRAAAAHGAGSAGRDVHQ